MLHLLAQVTRASLGTALTLEAIDQNLGGIPSRGHGAIKSAVSFIRVPRRRVQSQTLDTAGPHAPSAAASVEATAATHRFLLLQRVTPAGQLLLGGDGRLVIARVKTTNTGGALHIAGSSPVAAVDDGAAALAGVPLLGEAASWLEMVVVVLLAAAAAVKGGVVDVVVVCVGLLGVLLWEMRV